MFQLLSLAGYQGDVEGFHVGFTKSDLAALAQERQANEVLVVCSSVPSFEGRFIVSPLDSRFANAKVIATRTVAPSVHILTLGTEFFVGGTFHPAATGNQRWLAGPMLFVISVVEDSSVINTVATANILNPVETEIVGDLPL